jgi:hypothetical protein
MRTVFNFLLVYFPPARLYHAHHDNIGALVFVGLFTGLTCVDVGRWPFFATLFLKLGILAVVELAVLLGLHFYPAIA